MATSWTSRVQPSASEWGSRLISRYYIKDVTGAYLTDVNGDRLMVIAGGSDDPINVTNWSTRTQI